MYRKLAGPLVAGVMALFGASLSFGTIAPAHADIFETFNWSYTATLSGAPDNASGTLTIYLSTPHVSPDGTTAFDITSVSGTWNGVPIATLQPQFTCCPIPPPPQIGANDNFLFPSRPLALLSFGGFAFSDTLGNIANIYCFSPPACAFYQNIAETAAGQVVSDGVFALPGPIAGAGLPGLVAAGGGLLVWWQRRRRQIA